MLEAAGLGKITLSTYETNTRDETKRILQRYGWGGMLRVLWRTLLLYLRSPAYRRFVKSVRESGVIPENLQEYFGYGLFVGQK